MRLVQFLDRAGARTVGVVAEDGATLHVVGGAHRVYDLAMEAIRRNGSLAQLAREWQTREPVSYDGDHRGGPPAASARSRRLGALADHRHRPVPPGQRCGPRFHAREAPAERRPSSPTR